MILLISPLIRHHTFQMYHKIIPKSKELESINIIENSRSKAKFDFIGVSKRKNEANHLFAW